MDEGFGLHPGPTKFLASGGVEPPRQIESPGKFSRVVIRAGVGCEKANPMTSELMPHDEIHPVLRQIKPAAWEQLQRYMVRRVFEARKGIERPDMVWFLSSGAVRVYLKDHQSRETTVVVKSSPTIVGINEAFGFDSMEVAQALTQSKAIGFPASAVLWLVEHQPQFAQALLREQAEEIAVKAQWRYAQSFNSLEQRTRRLLMAYAEAFGAEESDGSVRLKERLSQTRLATDLGVTRKALFPILKSLKAFGFISATELVEGWLIHPSMRSVDEDRKGARPDSGTQLTLN